MTQIPEYLVNNLSIIRARLEEVASQAGRRVADIQLLPVTKTHQAEVCDWLAQLGFSAVGENRVQEVADKKPQVTSPLRWELIGHLQSNKVKTALGLFDRIQGVDSIKLAQKIASYWEDGRPPYPILLQINAGEDPAKSGVDPDCAEELLIAALQQPKLRVEGLMTIAPLSNDLSVARKCFARLRAIRDQLQERCGVKLSELSMGMSGDWEEAVKEGATLLRIGSALLGSRS